MGVTPDWSQMAGGGRPRAVVTGGAGFIGSHLVEALLAEGWRVGVVDDLSSGRVSRVPPEVELAAVDVRSPQARDFIRSFRPRAVAHLAAQVSVARSVGDPLLDADVNVGGTIAILLASREAGVRRVVFASSAAVYGAPAYLPLDEGHPSRPLSPYGISKLAGEHYVRVLAEASGVGWVVLRYANVYGPCQDAHGEAGVVAVFADRVVRGDRVLPVHGDGLQTRDFVYAGDVAEATLRAMTLESASGRILNVGTGRGTSVLELAQAIWRAAGREGPVPVEHQAARPGDIRHSRLDVSQAAQALGWQATVELEEGLRRTLRATSRRATS